MGTARLPPENAEPGVRLPLSAPADGDIERLFPLPRLLGWKMMMLVAPAQTTLSCNEHGGGPGFRMAKTSAFHGHPLLGGHTQVDQKVRSWLSLSHLSCRR
jgi:hypothetical protein